MLKSIGISGLVLLASLSIAAAQQTAPANQATDPIGDGPFKSQQGGKEEPGSHPPLRDKHGRLRRRQACGAGRAGRQPDRPGQGFGAQRAARRVPTMAMPLGLTDEQKQQILASVAKSTAGRADQREAGRHSARRPRQFRSFPPT